LSIALAGLGAVHFDNLGEGCSYGGSALDSALTSTVTEDRLLGLSRESGAVPIRPTWFLSGNNLAPKGDAYRRWLPCSLQTDLENPHERSDLEIADLRQHAAQNRGKLLRDALVILRSHALDGRRTGWPAPLGSFEEWDRIVHGAVWYAT